MKYESFNKEAVSQVRRDLQELLDKFAADNGLKVNLGRITYGNTDFRTTVRMLIPIEGADDMLTLDWKNKCGKYGFNPDDLGKTFRSGKNDDTFKIVGLKPRNRKYPVIARNLRDGKEYKFAPSGVRLGLVGTLPFQN